MRILVRAPNWIGDQVLAYPFFHYLRKYYPNALITVVCVPWVKDLQYRHLVDEVFVLESSARSGVWSRFENLNREVSRFKVEFGNQWDLGIALPNSFSAAWFLYRVGAKARRGFATELRQLLLTERVSWKLGEKKHRADAYLALLPEGAPPTHSAGTYWGVPPENDLDDPEPGEEKEFSPNEAWPRAKPIETPDMEYWVMAPGAAASSRRWMLDQFAHLARQMADHWNLLPVVVGGKNEIQLAESLSKDHGIPIVDYTARSSVAELSQVFAKARITVSNDSGLAHVASLCGSPVQVIWGAGDPNRTQPIGPGPVNVKYNPVECWPCEKNYCNLEDEGRLQCLRGIRAHDVWEEIAEKFAHHLGESKAT